MSGRDSPLEAFASTVASGGETHAGPLLPPDTRVADRFRVVRHIAAGGMGDVYEAEDEKLGGRVALKTIRRDLARTPEAVERLRREILVARKVTHEHVCRIHDVVVSGEDVFLTMELVGGETLASRLRRGGRMTPAEALPVASHLARGLDAAHRAGVVHRDFKSGNVILDGARAVITDFGLARALGGEDAPASHDGTGLVGTPAYMAPEQVAGEEVGPAADVYALGVVLFEMVTGSLPFTGETPLAVATRRLREPAPSVRGRAPGIPRRWDAVIRRCLEREPAERYPGVLDVARALQRPHPVVAPVLLAATVVTAALLVAPRLREPPPALRRRPISVLGADLRGVPLEHRWAGFLLGQVATSVLGTPPAGPFRAAQSDLDEAARTGGVTPEIRGARRTRWR